MQIHPALLGTFCHASNVNGPVSFLSSNRKDASNGQHASHFNPYSSLHIWRLRHIKRLDDLAHNNIYTYILFDLRCDTQNTFSDMWPAKTLTKFACKNRCSPTMAALGKLGIPIHLCTKRNCPKWVSWRKMGYSKQSFQLTFLVKCTESIPVSCDLMMMIFDADRIFFTQMLILSVKLSSRSGGCSQSGTGTGSVSAFYLYSHWYSTSSVYLHCSSWAVRIPNYQKTL
jgi:hypothetical protein